MKLRKGLDMAGWNISVLAVVGLAVVAGGGMSDLAVAGNPSATAQLTVGAPPSLRATLDDIIPMFEQEYGASVQLVYSPSKTLQTKVEQGAPIDVFLGAGMAEIGSLRQRGLTVREFSGVYGQTSLVLVIPTMVPTTTLGLYGARPDRVTRIALGDPKTSSMGDITARALSGLAPAYRHQARYLHAPHSQDVMDLVHDGKADLAIVYRIDAITNGQVRILDEEPMGLHQSVQFGHAVLSTCRDESRVIAEEFFHFLMTPRVQKLLLKYGFEPVSTEAPQVIARRS